MFKSCNVIVFLQVRTRTRGVVDAKYRLTVEELQLFATQLETLPAKVEGREAVESLLQQVDKFQTEAHKLLEEENPEAAEIEACVDFGLSLDIELTELTQLKEKQKQVKLFEE
jgi:histone demethylase JARID1